jgi:maltooligosyltrehalose trehalohydrolase
MCEFVVWAPAHEKLSVHICGPHGRTIPMTKTSWGYHKAVVDNVQPGARYLYRFENDGECPDPASRFQPDGVHQPSGVVDLSALKWTDSGWRPPRLEDSVFYEIHIGTYTPEGTLDSLRGHLPALASLGVTTIELMPVAQFSGERNWGYDGVYPYSVQNSYGGPEALQRFVDRAHAFGLAVALDVVYNHIGPEGNYLSQFGPYFTAKYKTPWGEAINYDDARSGPVRWFFIQNALYWFENYHIDVLRLDAIHGIFDFGALHVLAEMQKEVEIASEKMGRKLYLIAKSDLNDARVLHSFDKGGYGLAAQWSDDFHHSLHTLLTGESQGYYADFGSVHHLAETFRDGWYYHGQYSSYRRREHGNSSRGLSPSRFVVCNQNHDQVGNRAGGERLSTLVDFEAQKLAAGVTLLSPFVPLLFMGEEFGETSPFLYFTSHSDRDLIEAVRRGRREEFAAFEWLKAVPDPNAEETSKASKLHHDLCNQEPNRSLRLFYEELIRFRREHHLGAVGNWEIIEAEGTKSLTVLCGESFQRLLMIFNFDQREATPLALEGRWALKLDSADPRWRGPGSRNSMPLGDGDTVTLPPHSFIVLESEREH